MRDYTVKACETEECLVRLALICRKKKKLEKKRSTAVTRCCSGPVSVDKVSEMLRYCM